MKYSKKWANRMLCLAEEVSSWSKDPSTKVGAIIADDKKRVVALGYNGFPRGIEDTNERLNNRSTKYSMVVHAELNAILNANQSLDKTSLFVTHFPCNECAKAIIQSGIRAVYYPRFGILDQWMDSCEITSSMFEEAGISIFEINMDNRE